MQVVIATPGFTSDTSLAISEAILGGSDVNARLYFATDNAERVEPIEELSVVRLKGDLETAGGHLAAGASGTVVAVYGSGEAYMVEFVEPFHALETLSCEAIEAISGRSRADILADLGTMDR